MAELFVRSHAEIYFITDPKAYDVGLYFIECAAEADFMIDEFIHIFGFPNAGASSLCKNPDEKFWQFRKVHDVDYIIIVSYPGELRPTIFATSIHAYKQFADYVAEGIDCYRGAGESGC